MPIKEPESVIKAQKEAKDKPKKAIKATIKKRPRKSKRSKLGRGKIDVTVEEEEENIVKTPRKKLSCAKIELKKFKEIGKSRRTSSTNMGSKNWQKLKTHIKKNKFQCLKKKMHAHAKDMISQIEKKIPSSSAKTYNSNPDDSIMIDLTSYSDDLEPSQLEEVEYSIQNIADDIDSDAGENPMNNAQIQEFFDLINSEIQENTVLANIMNEEYKLEDSDIQLTLRIFRQYLPEFKIHDVQHFSHRTLVQPAELGENVCK
ncbi:hypothetical protein TKK_0002643 [Trichogramma kaykai]